MATTTGPAATTPHQALYRRWRAQTFAEIVGQAAVVETLRSAVRLDRLAHGLLFVGPRGTGKTSMARIVAKAVNCVGPLDGEPDDACEPCVAIREGRALDVVELDAASNNRVDDMRELLPRVYTAPADLRRKVFIIDEVQRIKEGWDVLLKTLEEPPPDVLFIFCTTDPSGIRPAVVSRLQRFTFRPLPVSDIEAKLRRILEAEGRQVTDEAITLIADRAAGGMRDAESILDQVLAGGGEAIDADAVRDLLGLAEGESVERFITALAAGDPLDGVRLLDELERDGRDLVAFADQAVDALRRQLVDALGSGDKAGPRVAALARAARRLSTIDLNRGAAGGYRLQLELALLEAAPSGGRPVVERNAIAPAAAAKPSKPVAQPSASPDPVPVAAAPGAPARSDEGELQQLLDAWPRVVEEVGRHPASRPLILACRPLEMANGVVVLGFPEDQVFLRDIAERKRTVLEEGISSVLGVRVAIRCVAANIELPATSDQAAGDLIAQARQVFADDVLDVAEVE